MSYSNVNKKTTSLISSKGSGDSYILEKEHDQWIINPSLASKVPYISRMDISVKVDGSNSVVAPTKNGLTGFYKRYDWRKSVAILYSKEENGKIIYKIYLPFGKFPPKYLKKYLAKDPLPGDFPDLNTLYEKKGYHNYDLVILGDHKTRQQFEKTTHYTKSKNIPFNYSTFYNVDLIFGEKTDNGLYEVVYVLTPVSIVDLLLPDADNGIIVQRNVPLEIVLKMFPRTTFEQLTPNIQGGRYNHYGLVEDKQTVTITPHGVFPVPISLLKKLPEGFSTDIPKSLNEFSNFVDKLYDFAITFSYDEKKPREGLVIKFWIDDEYHLFKINEGHMETYDKMMTDGTHQRTIKRQGNLYLD